jgi:lipopolysaccharide assembly outer membrane protein LptD (OstA)
VRRSVSLLAAAALLAASPSPAPSGSPAPVVVPSGESATFNVGVWTVHSSLLDVNFKNGDFSTPSQLTMTRGGGDITADRANGNYKTKRASLFGHVVMHDTQGNFAGLSSVTPAKTRGPSTLTADQVDIDGEAKVYTATGNVHYVQVDTVVDSEKGVLNDLTHELDLSGNVHIVQGERNMIADHVLYNTITGQAHAEGNVTMQFPSEVNPHVATPKPIKITNPLQKGKPAASPSPSSHP